MATSDILRFAGDVNIESAQLVTSKGVYIDIANQIAAVQLFEDIFSPFITGTLIIKDTLDMLNAFPLSGEEYLWLSIKTPTMPKGNIEGKFYIFKMSNREMLGDKSIVYELHFITQEAIVDINKPISRAFDGKPSEIAKKIFTDKDIGLQIAENRTNIEETTNSIKFVSNFWTPTRCLKYLCDHSMNKNESPTYVFFENRAGFNFVSLDALYTNDDIIEHFTYDNYIRDKVGSDGDARNIVEDYRRISRVAVPVVHDYLDRVKDGMYSSRQYSFDIMSKNVSISDYNMFLDWQAMKHTNPNPLSSEKTIHKSRAKIINHQRHYDNFTGKGDSSNYAFLQRRISQMKSTDASKIEITVPGRTQYTVGQRCVVELNKLEPDDGNKGNTDTMDKMLSGAYIIGAINHYIDREKHECVMELFKDSLFRNLNENS